MDTDICLSRQFGIGLSSPGPPPPRYEAAHPQAHCLTSIRLDKYQLGMEAVKTLVAMIRTSKGSHGIKKVVRPSLIQRESTVAIAAVVDAPGDRTGPHLQRF